MRITQSQLRQIIKEELEAVLSESDIMATLADIQEKDSERAQAIIDAARDMFLDKRSQKYDGLKGKDKGLADQLIAFNKQKFKKTLNEADGKGCADTDKGCIRKREGGWVILNNKKGGVWRKCDSRSHCEEILDAFHAAKG
jgi:hypothetical protein